MPLFINTNVASLNAQRNLNVSTGQLGQTFARLSSGLRINSAKDDAAGLAISARMTSQVRGLNQAIRNANDGISLAQVAEGALDQTTNALQRIRELAVQSANSTYNSSDRADLQKEVDQLVQEIQRIATDVEFNKTPLLSGGFTGQAFHVGTEENQTIKLSIGAAHASALGVGALSTDGTMISNITISTTAKAESALSKLTNALNSISDLRATLGAVQNRFESVIQNLSNVVENMSAARSRIMDADIAAETATLTRNAILQQAGTAVLAQANQQPQLALQLLG
ncbi:MAG: flagellin FliC [Magnetococcales bacterium]|nr:flagellin FliC [Magnetococcales bacterium]MBF0156258.1 flagellin FliC [Magnetococcales bacterium]